MPIVMKGGRRAGVGIGSVLTVGYRSTLDFAIVTVTCGVEGVGIEGVVGDKLCVATLERETGDEDFRKFFHESMGSIGFGLY